MYYYFLFNINIINLIILIFLLIVILILIIVNIIINCNKLYVFEAKKIKGGNEELINAIRNNNIELVTELLDNNYDLIDFLKNKNPILPSRENILFIALKSKCSINIIKLLLIRKPSLILLKDESNIDVLSVALEYYRYNNNDILNFLLNFLLNFNPNFIISEDTVNTAILHNANYVQTLLEYFPQYIPTYMNLHTAITFNRIDLVDLFLEKNPNSINPDSSKSQRTYNDENLFLTALEHFNIYIL
jgi:hypothetical protein